MVRLWTNWQLHLRLREHEGGNDGESDKKREKAGTFGSSKHINNEDVINEAALMDSLKLFLWEL